MAHEAVALSPLNLINGGSFFGQPIIPVRVSFETPNTPLTIYSSLNKRIYLIGWEMVVENEASVKTYIDDTHYVDFKFGANSGQGVPLTPGDPGIIIVTESNKPLILNSDSALPPHLMYVCAI